jgi:sulfoxide reductase heme-binding subunit YedZ
MTPSLSRHLPWSDRNGRFSLLRATVFVAVWVPAALLIQRWATGDLGPRPLAEAIHVAGDWAVRLLLVAVAITPLRHLSGSARLIGVRRMIGLAALAYALLHVLLWAADLAFAPASLAFEIAVRPYLTLGFVAVVGLVALGVTSTDGQVRRLGAARWKRLHGLVHPILILALVHLFLQSKLDLSQGAILSGIAFGGLALRTTIGRGRPLGLAAVAIAGTAAVLGGAAAEAVWFVLKTGRSVVPLLEANFAFEARIAPAWFAGAITLGVAVAALALRTLRRHRDARAGRAARRQSDATGSATHAGVPGVADAAG